MKRIITSLFLLYSAISFTMEQGEDPPYKPMYATHVHDYLRHLIKTKDTEELYALIKDKGGFFWGYYFNELDKMGIFYAAWIGSVDICKFLLHQGSYVGLEDNPLTHAKNIETIQTILTNCIVRPSNFSLNSAYKRSITFLLCTKKICPLMPKEMRTRILGEAGFIGDLMIKRLLKGEPIREELFKQTQNRLFLATLAGLTHLRHEALAENPAKEIPDPCKFKDEILATIAQRMTSTPFLCNTQIREPQNTDAGCSIL